MTGISPAVSVVTVVLNRAACIERTIQSVIGQSYGRIEYIVIDGGSRDGTKDVIERYRDKISFWSSGPDSGLYDAMNKGVGAATGGWIHFLNAGDVFCRQDTIQQAFSAPYGVADLLYGDEEVVYGPGCAVIKKARPHRDIWKGMIFNHQSLFVKTALLREHPFRTEYRIAADYEFVLFSFVQGAGLYYLGFPIASVALGGLSDMNVSAHIREQWQIARRFRDTARINTYYRYALASAAIKKVLKTLLPQNARNAIVKCKYR